MATPRSSFIIKKYDGFGGNFLDSQYLGEAFDADKPHIFERSMMKIFSSRSRFFTSKALVGMTGAKSFGVKEIDNEVYRWRLQGAERKWARSMSNIETSTTPGLNNEPFKIKLDLDFYHTPDVLFSEDNEVPLFIIDGPEAEGDGFVYTVKIQTDNPQVFLDPSFLDEGREFSKVWTSVQSEYNKVFGTQQVPNTFMLESQLGYFAQSIHVTDKAMRREGRLAFEFMHTDYAGNTQTATNFMPVWEAKMWDEFYRSMEAQAMYGKKSTSPSQDGYWLKTGPGLREQLRDSWLAYYNGPLSVNAMKDYLMNIFFARENEEDRKVIAINTPVVARCRKAA